MFVARFLKHLFDFPLPNVDLGLQSFQCSKIRSAQHWGRRAAHLSENKGVKREGKKFEDKWLLFQRFVTSIVALHSHKFILADTYSPWKDTFKPPSWKAIWDWVRVWKHFPWIFHLVDLFLSLVSIIIQFIFLFSCLSCDFHQNNGKKKFSTGHPPWYILVAISVSWLVLVIGFSNNSINTVSFSIYFPFNVIFIKKWQKTSDCNFQHRATIMEGCWRTSASSCCKSWRGSCGHRS